MVFTNDLELLLVVWVFVAGFPHRRIIRIELRPGQSPRRKNLDCLMQGLEMVLYL